MAEVTSGNNLVVIVLEEGEANALARLLGWNEMQGRLEENLRSLLHAVSEVK